MQLSTLVEKIEFFHLKNGKYPERLEELQEIDPFAPIVDPLQMHNKSDSVNFNYYKIENRYTVFSSGVDGQAGTEDDFYPEIQMDSTSKVGLILKDPNG